MRPKLDENIGQRGLTLLKQAGHDVATVVEQGLASTPDENLIEVCRREGRRLVSLDYEFDKGRLVPFLAELDKMTSHILENRAVACRSDST
ncbi:MAG: DUF5615 family PIN-like protein [Cyanobacteria bacterium P01_C01_bin.120]